MQEDPQAAEHRRRLNLDPRNLDPRKALDPAALERVLKAQALARAQAQAATTVVIGTIVTLITSAFGFVAALAWNDALTNILNNFANDNLRGLKLTRTEIYLMKAVIITIIAVVAVVIISRVAGRWAKRSAIGATAGDGSY